VRGEKTVNLTHRLLFLTTLFRSRSKYLVHPSRVLLLLSQNLSRTRRLVFFTSFPRRKHLGSILPTPFQNQTIMPKAALPVSHDHTKTELQGKSRDGTELQPKTMDGSSLMVYGLTETPHTTPVLGSDFNAQSHPISECIEQLQEQVESARFQNYKARRLNRSMDSGTSTGSIDSVQTPFHEPSMASFAKRSITISTSWRSESCLSFKDFPSLDWQCDTEAEL
jgi:hypothetical protein